MHIAKEIKVNEEKLLNNLKDYLNYLKGKNLMTSFRFNIVDLLENSISLIEKQQKEIEDLKQIDKHITKETVEFVNSHYISKNEIGEKIKEYQEKAEDVKQKYKGVYAYKDDYLEALAKIEGYQELLEENTNEWFRWNGIRCYIITQQGF